MVLMSLNDADKTQLLKLAHDSIEHGLQTGQPLSVNPENYPAALAAKRASFVTLQRNGQLRGCIGMLEAIRPLVQDVAENAFAAAFRDPRFPALTRLELLGLDVHISILSAAEIMHFQSEADLLKQLKPGIDGLILQDGYHRGTFLPSVWEQLPEAEQFLRHLKQKAGLPADYWSNTLKTSRYTTEILS